MTGFWKANLLLMQKDILTNFFRKLLNKQFTSKLIPLEITSLHWYFDIAPQKFIGVDILFLFYFFFFSCLNSALFNFSLSPILHAIE